jgi:hypothetical protein
MVAGKLRRFSTYYHSTDINLEAVNSSRRLDYMDLDDLHTQIYRWARNGVVTWSMKIENKYVRRTYFAMCKLGHHTDDGFVLLAILRTLCCTPKYEYLVMREEQGTCEMWQESKIKPYWCVPDYPLDVEELENRRHQHFESCQWYYRKDRNVPIDTHNPGNFSKEYQCTEKYCLDVFKKWEQKIGLQELNTETTTSTRQRRSADLKSITFPPTRRKSSRLKNKSGEKSKQSGLVEAENCRSSKR